MMENIYESTTCYFLRKPAGLASTRGKQACFLDVLKNGSKVAKEQKGKGDFFTANFDALGGQQMQELFFTQLHQTAIISVPDGQEVIKTLFSDFSAEQEYGLLNRLDTDTSWLLYFAKTPEIYTQFSERQAMGKIRKYYLARIRGDPVRNLSKIDMPFTEQQDDRNFSLSFSMMHHVHDDEKMLTFISPDQQTANEHRGRGKVHTPTTRIEVLSYDVGKNESIVLATITKGVRHQIRVHLAALGTPILGDPLYNTQTTEKVLQLVSCGCSVG